MILIIRKIISVQEVPFSKLMIVQTIKNGQAILLQVIFGTMAEKYGATLKAGSCTLLLIWHIWKDKTTVWSFAQLE